MRVGPILGGITVTMFLAGCSLNANPYAPLSVPYVAVSADGRYLGAVTLSGDLRVYDLESREKVFEPPRGAIEGVTAGHVIKFVAFQGTSGRVLWDCAFGHVCFHDLESGEDGTFFEHDPQDNVRHGVVSSDGERMAFGTAGGRIFTYEPASGEQRELKPKDVWTVGGGPPIYTLEGTESLDFFVSASSLVGLGCGGEFGDRWWVYRNREEGHAKYIKYSGVVVWEYATGEAHEICDGFSDKVRAAFSPAGDRVAVSQESGSRFNIYALPSVTHTTGRPVTVSTHGTRGLGYLDRGGRFLASAFYQNDFLTVYDTTQFASEGAVTNFPLRTRPAGGRRMLVSYPERGWVFVGLRNGGVDWYRFRAGDPPSLDHIATLK